MDYFYLIAGVAGAVFLFYCNESLLQSNFTCTSHILSDWHDRGNVVVILAALSYFG